MISEDEKTEFFDTIFAPLKEKLSAMEVKKAVNRAELFFKSECFTEVQNNDFKNWSVVSLNETEIASWRWLVGMRKAYSSFYENGIEIYKFVWHKKPDEVGWGPKVVLGINAKDGKKIQYITKKMNGELTRLVAEVGTTFNLLQPILQGDNHGVTVREEDELTALEVSMEAGKTLDTKFDELISSAKIDVNELDTLFEKIIQLYLMPEIGSSPAVGIVEPIKYGKEWKYGYEWIDGKNPQLKFLRDFEINTPFIIPLRKKEQHIPFTTILHGDEWGGNFMTPPSNSGSIRPIDFEDAHIQRVEVELDEQQNIISFLKPSECDESHKTAGGDLAYRVTNDWKGETPPLHAYSAMSALGRLFAALVQKQTLKSDPVENDDWIEDVTARFFNTLRNSLSDTLSNKKITETLTSLNLPPGDLQRGLMVRAVLAAYNWSEHWKYKERDNDEHNTYYQGKWKKSSLEEFQFQLGIQGEWEVCSRDSHGQPTTHGHDYAEILRNEIQTSNDWTDIEKEDILKAISMLDEYGNKGVRVARKQYRELIDLDNLLPFEKTVDDLHCEIRIEPTKYERLANKIDFINAHFVIIKEEIRELPETMYRYFHEAINYYPVDKHWKDIWLIWRDIYSFIGREFPEDAIWTMKVNFDAHILAISNNKFIKILNTFETGTLDKRDEQAYVRNLAFSEYITYLNSFRKRIALSSLVDTSILIDSRISRFCHDTSKVIFNNPSKMDYTDLDFLTELLLVANEHDREFVETGFAFDIPFYVMAIFAELGFNDKTIEIERFFDALSDSVKKCFTICANKKEDSGATRLMMEYMLGIISNPKHQLLRFWATEFLVYLNPQTKRALEDLSWYKCWINLELIPSFRYSKLLNPSSPNYEIEKRIFW